VFAFPLSICALLPALVFCVAAVATMPPFGHFRFVKIDIPSSPYVEPLGINNAAVVTGYYGETGGRDHGFVWQNGTFKTVDYPGATDTHLNGINNRGVVIGTYLIEVGSFDDAHSIQHAVTYSLSSSAWTVFPKIRGYPSASGDGINDSGIAVGFADGLPFGHLAWIWHPDSQTYSYFKAPGGESSTHPQGISANGKIVGQVATEVQSGTRNSGFLRDRDHYQEINVTGAVWTIPMGVNNNGTVSGWILTSTNGYFGFVRSSGGVFTMVNYPGSTWTHVDGINDHGTICGYWYNPASGYVQGFVGYPR
jgi:hypothetical protein